MDISLQDILQFTEADFSGDDSVGSTHIKEIVFDSRKSVRTGHALFVGLSTDPFALVEHVEEAFDKGVLFCLTSNSLVKELSNGLKPELLNHLLFVPDVLSALQKLAKSHRLQYDIPLIGITGSNGKTIVKEWLSQVLDLDHQLCKSPASYNSQLGVALSLLELEERHDIGVFEAGISKDGEMRQLSEMIQCNFGILTNIGDAHDVGFLNREHKFKEKWKLFNFAEKVILEKTELIDEYLSQVEIPKFQSLVSWSRETRDADYFVQCTNQNQGIQIKIEGRNTFEVDFHLVDRASVSNIIHVIIASLELGLTQRQISTRIAGLEPVSMRMLLKKVSRNCLLIDDSYNADLTSLENALDFAQEQKKERKLYLILSDFEQVRQDQAYFNTLKELIERQQIDLLYYVGEDLAFSLEGIPIRQFDDESGLRAELDNHPPEDALILLKGARKYQLDQLIRNFEVKSHRTTLEISLDAIRYNLQRYRSMHDQRPKMMAVIKAGAYGSDSIPLAKHLLRCGIDYLAVAYFDEAIELREEGIDGPIMIMNPDPSQEYLAAKYDLELEIYSLEQLEAFLNHANEYLKIHLKIDSGMNRLGFKKADLPKAIELIKENRGVEVKSIFSHFAAAEDPQQDVFTEHQYQYFRTCFEFLKAELSLDDTMQHICNSNAAVRFKSYQHDMIRLGIGLYGYVPNEEFQMAHKLCTYIAQIKHIEKGDSVGYNRSFIASSDMKIATLSIGYADGLSRKLGNGNACFYGQGKELPTVGHISMDTCVIDITNLDFKAGDEIVIFETISQFNQFCKASQKTAYEVMSNIGTRVVRNYVRY